MTYFRHLLLVITCMSQLAIAEEFVTTPSQGDFKQTARVMDTRGVIQSIDLVTRTVVISGYAYDFGPDFDTVEVKLYNSDAGALELLKPGMKVEVTYVNPDRRRVPISVIQLSNSTVIEDF